MSGTPPEEPPAKRIPENVWKEQTLIPFECWGQ
ncbi:hypothetical protein KIPB_013315, partial [Kipferlia bialata]|eukprot:g13315.t1